MARQGRCIFLTGAPNTESLDWSEARLLTVFTIGPSSVTENTASGIPQPTASWQAPKWRSLAAEPERKERRRETPQPEFFSFSAQIPDLDIASKQDFLDHSRALIDDLVSSQLAPTNVDETTLLDSTAFSFASEISIPSQISLSPEKPSLALSTNIPLTDVKQIPSASHILAIAPQTVTLNLLCAVISVSQPRIVAIRRRQATMEIQDLLIGASNKRILALDALLKKEELEALALHGTPDVRTPHTYGLQQRFAFPLGLNDREISEQVLDLLFEEVV